MRARPYRACPSGAVILPLEPKDNSMTKQSEFENIADKSFTAKNSEKMTYGGTGLNPDQPRTRFRLIGPHPAVALGKALGLSPSMRTKINRLIVVTVGPHRAWTREICPVTNWRSLSMRDARAGHLEPKNYELNLLCPKGALRSRVGRAS